MESTYCMNELCRVTSSHEWKKGWTLKSGGYATLCHNCGSAFENAVFCETFHSKESGWRDCRICAKRLHCGCIASRHVVEYMDFGGVKCINCVKNLEVPPVPSIQIPANIPNGTLATNGIKDAHSMDRIDNDKFSTDRLLKLTKALGVNDVSSHLDEMIREGSQLKPAESVKHATNLIALNPLSNLENIKLRPKDANESLAQPLQNLSFATPLRGSSTGSPFPIANTEGSDSSKRTRPSLQKPPKPSPSLGSESTNNKGSGSQTRIPRPPIEGRGRNQLLPRYWPRITDQELQKLSGDLNSTIVPLFEKTLSASDAGRIGRLVLPKACAEAYFPTINQSEGIPIKIQDIKGKEWTFQFRFWPNNNSRMYVLEGVTPCIQDMQMQAGDTVIFSRRDPGGQLVIGCRKSSSNTNVQDSQSPVTATSAGEASFSSATEKKHQKVSGTSNDFSHIKNMSSLEKKKARNIKNKRLHMNNDDVMELRFTLEEAQELFRPYPSSEPTIVVVEEHEFEEFEEPPVFGKKTIFISRPSGEQEQLAQCDLCLKWRRLPVHALLSANWTCSENILDSKRYTCSTPEDINPCDLESDVKDSKKRRVSDSKTSKEGEPSGLDALATAAVLGDNIAEMMGDSSSVVEATTTRHPRHRPGCTCIVCSQPPSGKGKHDPSCNCNVCLTVRRRFKTLMMRKKKRLSEREAELNQEKGGDDHDNKDQDPAMKIDEDIAGHALLNMINSDNGNTNNTDSYNDVVDFEDMNNGKLDLNSDPHKEDDIVVESSGLKPCLASREVTSNEGDSSAVEKEGVVESRDVEQENKVEDDG